MTEQLNLKEYIKFYIKPWRSKQRNMAIIAPFKGLTYNYYIRNDFSKMVAPPYDVISSEEQESFYQLDPYNVIRLILAKKKTGDSDWDNRYTRSADFFRRWESAGILIRSNEPCLYITSLSYDPGDGLPKRTRWGIIALARIEDPDSGVILPHEKTFSAHKDDRLKLMRACEAQVSQIFGLYEDSQDIVMSECKKALDFQPQIDFDTQDGTSHRMWILRRPDIFKLVTEAMAEKSIFIADGHHRYETARNYRNIMRSRHGRLDPQRSYEFVMTYLSNMNDKGLTILPSHRLIKRAQNFDLTAFLKKAEGWFNIEKLELPDSELPVKSRFLKVRLEQAGKSDTVIAFVHADYKDCYLMTLKKGGSDDMGEDLHPSQKKLDVLVLSRLILQKSLGFQKDDLDNEEIFHYLSSTEKTLDQVFSGDYEMSFLLNPTKIDHVKEIADNSLVMPRKSTFFYPKILSGLVFNKIDPNETIQIP